MEFKYIASDANGKRVASTASMDSMHALVGRLKQEGLTPIHIEIAKSKFAKKRFLFSAQVKSKELAIFTRQLATVLNAGILLTEALETIAEDMENRYFRDCIRDLAGCINAGGSLSEGLLGHADVFPPIFISLVKAGEEIGNLGSALSSLAKYLEDYEAMREKIMNAFRYPIIVVCFMMIIVSIMLFVVIPKFQTLFSNAGAQLPLLTRIVVGTSTFLLTHTLMGISILVVIWAVIWYLLRIFKIRFIWHYYQLRLPLFGPVIRKVNLARYCRTLSTLLSGGVTIVSSLMVSNKVTNNLFLKHVFDDVRNNVIAGAHLSDALRFYKEIPRILVKMVAVGERAGKLDEMFRRTADYYEEELTITLNKLSALIEPLLIAIIGAVVLIMALALYLPIFKLSMAIR